MTGDAAGKEIYQAGATRGVNNARIQMPMR